MRDAAFIPAVRTSGSNGNFNYHMIGSEYEGLSSSQSAEGSLLGVNMEVDGDMVDEREIPLEGIKNITIAELDASRGLLDNFLIEHTAYELFPDSGKVVALDITLPVKQAFHVLYEQGISAAPLWDSREKQFVGMLTASDFIEIVIQIQARQASLSEQELETHTIAAWKQEKCCVTGALDPGSSLQYIGPDDTLKSVVKSLIRHQITTLPVLYFHAEDNASPQLLHLASLSGVLKCLYRHFRHAVGFLPLFNLPICSLPVGNRGTGASGSHFLLLKASDSLSTALSLLLQARVDAIPIVNKDGCLVDIFARRSTFISLVLLFDAKQEMIYCWFPSYNSDITALARGNFYTGMQPDRLTIEQVLQIVRASTSVAPGTRYQTCFEMETLHAILERLASTGARQIVCVEPGSHHVKWVITVADIFRFLLSE